MPAPSLRKWTFGAVGLVALAGLAGCQCAGQTAPRRTASARGGNGPVTPYAEQDLVLERLDRLQMEMDSRMAGLQNDVNDIRTRQLTPTVVETYTPPVVSTPAVANDWDLLPPPDTRTVGYGRMEPVVSRPAPTSLAANRASLAAKHLRVPGVTVEQLQRALVEADFSPGKVDGIMGKRTIDAIRQFQRNNQLTVDGVVGRQTWALLQAITGAAGRGPGFPAK